MKNFLDFMAAERTPGNAIVIYQDGELVYHYASGYSDLEAKIPMTGERILSPYTVDLMRTDRLTSQQKEYFSWGGFFNGYGYGLGVRTHIDPALSGSIASIGEFGWGGAAGSSIYVDPDAKLGIFYVQHCLNPREHFYQPRVRNAVYSCLDKKNK